MTPDEAVGGGLLLGDDEETVEPTPEPDEPPEHERDGDAQAQATIEAVEEWPFEVELVEIASLFTDDRYQRPIQERFVAMMAEDFDETLVGCIDVSDRADGTHAILDGQQRVGAMRIIPEPKTTCYAAVFTDMDLEDEAGFFYRKNKDRKAMKGFYGFRARLVAGDLDAVGIDDAVRSEGFELAEKTDHVTTIGAISTVETAWGLHSVHRSEALSPALRTLKTAWPGREDSLSSQVIAALARFWGDYPDEAVHPMVLTRALEEIGSPGNWIGLGRERTKTGTPLYRGMASALVSTYNRVRPEGYEALEVG